MFFFRQDPRFAKVLRTERRIRLWIFIKQKVRFCQNFCLFVRLFRASQNWVYSLYRTGESESPVRSLSERAL